MHPVDCFKVMSGLWTVTHGGNRARCWARARQDGGNKYEVDTGGGKDLEPG